MNATLASVWERTARGVFIALTLSACGQSTTDGAGSGSVTNVTDTASAYLALSDEVKACKDAQDACVTAAAGDATQVAACDTAATSCIDATRATAGDARRRLGDDADSCVRECRRSRGRGRDDADGGADEGDSTRDCFGRRGAPFVESECSDAFFTCLDESGVRESGTDELDDATKAAVAACVDAAHSCVTSEMRSGSGGWGGRGRGGPGRDRGPGRDGDASVEDRGPRGAGAGGDDGDRRGPGRGRGRGEAGAPADAGI
jgi:hypothetical protein